MNRDEYVSTLEIHAPDPGLHVLYSNQPQVASPAPGTDAPITAWPVLCPISTASVSPSYASVSQHQGNKTAGALAPEPIKRYELTRKRIIILCVTALVLFVMAAVIGACIARFAFKSSTQAVRAGSPSDSSNNSTNSNTNTTGNINPNTPVPSSLISRDSKINALNWTDSGNITQYNAVFWQDSYSNLAMSIWNSKYESWASTNITEKFENSTPPAAKAGSPLAATVQSWPLAQLYGLEFSISLFYIDKSNIVQHIVTSEMTGGSWTHGSLSTSGSQFTINQNSQIAAWWHGCANATDCNGDTILYYQDTSGVLQLANSSDWSTTAISAFTGSIMTGTGLGATAIDISPGGSYLRVDYCQANEVHAIAQNGPWADWEYYPVIAKGLPEVPPRLATLGFVSTDTLSQATPVDIIVIQTYANYTLLANYWSGSLGLWTGNNELQVGGQRLGNLSAVSAVADLKVFALTIESELVEYLIDRRSPMTWTYTGKVNITG